LARVQAKGSREDLGSPNSIAQPGAKVKTSAPAVLSESPGTNNQDTPLRPSQ